MGKMGPVLLVAASGRSFGSPFPSRTLAWMMMIRDDYRNVLHKVHQAKAVRVCVPT